MMPRSGETSATSRPNPSAGGLIILVPLFNDWEALRLLLIDLDDVLLRAELDARILVVDDASTIEPDRSFPGEGFHAIGRIEVLTLLRNLGHQRAIAIGLAYAQRQIPCRALVLMDGDGEDAPSDVPRLLASFEEEGGAKIIFAERVSRSESATFVLFYNLYKLIHLVLTGHPVRVGNFSVIPGSRLRSLMVVSEIWNHYPAAVIRSRQPFETVPTRRARRLFGRPHMNFTRLVVHGLSAISVYSDVIGVRLLMTSLSLMGLAVFGLLAVILIRVFTDAAIPGWATSSFGLILVILLQAVMFSVVFSFTILAGRQGPSFLPCRDFIHYVGDVIEVYNRDSGPSIGRETSEGDVTEMGEPDLPE